MKIVTTLEEAKKSLEENPDEPIKCQPRPTTRKVCRTIEEAEKIFAYFEKPAPATLEIELYLHCGLCLKQKPGSQSPEEWARLAVGWTPHGLQVWCVRHGCNVAHIDFEGQQHPANTSLNPDGFLS